MPDVICDTYRIIVPNLSERPFARSCEWLFYCRQVICALPVSANSALTVLVVNSGRTLARGREMLDNFICLIRIN